jgi:hypothetical protein
VAPVQAQRPYYDALELAKHLDPDGKVIQNQAALDILARYVEEKARDQVFTRFEYENPFIEKSGSGQSGDYALGGPNAIAGIGGISVTKFSEGLAKFLVARAKQELTASFFNKFKEELDDPEFEDLRILFSSTYSVLMVVDTEVYRYELYLTSLREAFKKDLRNLINTVPEVLDNHQDLFAGNPKLRATLDMGFVLARRMGAGTHAASIVGDPQFLDAAERINADLRNSLMVFNIFSNSLKSADPDRYWVSADSLALLSGRTLRLYLGLVYETIPQDLTIGAKNVRAILDSLATSQNAIAGVGHYLNRLIEQGNVVDGYVKVLRNSKLTDATYQDYYRYFIEIVKLIEFALHMDFFPHAAPSGEFTDSAIAIVTWVRHIGDIHLDVSVKNYSSALYNVVALLDLTLGNEFKYRSQLIKYGSFVAATAQAESSDQVKDIIEAAVLPPGSASIKRKTRSNISINAYLGGSWGREKYSGRKSEIYAGWAPIGIAVSTGPRIKGRDIGSITAFISLIDIGAVTAYRVEDDSTATLPELELRNILAPGLSVIWGMPWAPLSIGCGYQLGPELRAIEEGAATSVEATYRFHGFVAVDIPLFNLHTKPR